MARNLSVRVLVEHPRFGRKEVLRSRLPALSPRWRRVSSGRPRVQAPPVPDAGGPPSDPPAEAPDADTTTEKKE